MSKVLLKNIGTIVSGYIADPILSGDAILIEYGKIKQVGAEGDLVRPRAVGGAHRRRQLAAGAVAVALLQVAGQGTVTIDETEMAGHCWPER